MSLRAMARWRSIGDPLCDDALQVVFESSSSSIGKDLLATLEHYAAANPGDSAVHTFLRQVSQHPTPGLQVTAQEAELAQELFLDNSVEFNQALLHYSLAGGFAR